MPQYRDPPVYILPPPTYCRYAEHLNLQPVYIFTKHPCCALIIVRGPAPGPHRGPPDPWLTCYHQYHFSARGEPCHLLGVSQSGEQLLWRQDNSACQDHPVCQDNLACQCQCQDNKTWPTKLADLLKRSQP